MKISNQPYKGTSDWMPEEFRIRKAIFDRWRNVCRSYKYEEYLTPLIEPIELYKAKSGEDLGGKELMTIVDRAGRELAIRPEMTPSVTRMITKVYEGVSKPIRLFSIANFMRAEKPQRGRNREFWQLNFDIFGSNSIEADLEVLMIALDIMLSFQPPEGSFSLYLNHRGIISDFSENIIRLKSDLEIDLMRAMDKYEKLSNKEFDESLRKLSLDDKSIEAVKMFINSDTKKNLLQNFPQLSNSTSLREITYIEESLFENGYEKWFVFKPNVIRGLDYYDGMVFEVFDNSSKNIRSIFGGGRYNGLSEIFGVPNIPAVGCAIGDETLKLFIDSWDRRINLLEEERNSIYIPVLDLKFSTDVQKVAKKYRKDGFMVETGVEVMKVGKAFRYAGKKGFSQIILLGQDEVEKNFISLKNLDSGVLEEIDFDFN